MAWTCFTCSATSDAARRPWWCWSCGSVGTWRVPQRRTLTERVRSSIGPRSARSIVQASYELQRCPVTDLTWARPAWFLLYGPPGAGKSTLAYQMACGNAPDHPVLVFANEEHPGPPMARRLVIAGAGRRTDVTVDTSGDVTGLLAAARQGHAIVIDSLTAAAYLRPDDLLGLIEVGCPLLVSTAHVTKTGTARGTTAWGHDCDVVIRLEAGGYWNTEKNRYGECGRSGAIRGVATSTTAQPEVRA